MAAPTASSRDPAAGRSAGLWWRWVIANSWSEAVGLGTSGLVAALLLVRAEGPAALVGAAFAVVVLAGLAEGGVVGWAQARVLRGPLPELAPRRWIVATIVGATVAWTLGMVPPTLVDLSGAATGGEVPEPGLALQLALAVLLGAVAGPILGAAQAWVLRAHCPRAWRWLPANALAWALGMPLVFAIAGSAPPGWPPGAVAALVVTTLALVGAVVGAVHGAVLVRMLEERGARTAGEAHTVSR